MADLASNLETLDRAIEYYAEHANGRGGTAWMNPATVLETLALLRELKRARPAAQSWESYEAAQERRATSGETPAEPLIDWKASYVEAIRQRDALQTDANRYRWLRDFTYVEAYWIDGAGGVDELRLQGSVHFLDQAVDLERIKDAPRSPPKTGAEHG